MTTQVEKWRRKWASQPLPPGLWGQVWDHTKGDFRDGREIWEARRREEFIRAVVEDRLKELEPELRRMARRRAAERVQKAIAGGWLCHKTYRVWVKDVGNGLFEATVSSGKRDRDNEVILPSAWSKRLGTFRLHPILVSSHEYRDLRHQIGEVPYIRATEDGLRVRLQYYVNEGNPEADWAAKLAAKGRAAYSVGFIPHSWEPGGREGEPKRTYSDVELLEISHVIIPSQPDALVSVR